MLDDIPRSMPAVLEAAKLGSRAAKVGFDWPDARGTLREAAGGDRRAEAELSGGRAGSGGIDAARVEEELGDLLFTAVNLARHLKVDPESALRGANAKFRQRFAAMESAAGGREGLESRSAPELEALWSNAKRAGKTGAKERSTMSPSQTNMTRPGMRAAIRIASLHELDEFQSCVDLQLAVWGYSDGDLIPRRMFLLADRIGGQVLGAFDGDGRIVGFAMALPGYRDGQPYLHSHMLAVLPEYRNLGLGRRLKLAQRDDALARGFELMEWTFDPLEIKNAHLNIARLGAICRRYYPDFYGPSSSPLQGGLPTDRLYAEWWLRSPRVLRVLAKRAAQGTANTPRNGGRRGTGPARNPAWKQDPESRKRALEVQRATARRCRRPSPRPGSHRLPAREQRRRPFSAGSTRPGGHCPQTASSH